jgi:hypothetical protein
LSIIVHFSFFLSFPRKRESIFFLFSLCSLWLISFYCIFYPQTLINTNKKSGLFSQQAAFLKNLNKFITANYRRLLDLFRRPPPHIGIFTVNSPHNKTIKPNPSPFVKPNRKENIFTH